jgi:hypothetical protein
MMNHETLESFLREQGPLLEQELLKVGTTLPPGLTGESMLRSLAAGAERVAKDPRIQAFAKRVAEVYKDVAAELPGGENDPDFLKRVDERVRPFLPDLSDDPFASA